jgi:hypothetical protein
LPRALILLVLLATLLTRLVLILLLLAGLLAAALLLLTGLAILLVRILVLLIHTAKSCCWAPATNACCPNWLPEQPVPPRHCCGKAVSAAGRQEPATVAVESGT